MNVVAIQIYSFYSRGDHTRLPSPLPKEPAVRRRLTQICMSRDKQISKLVNTSIGIYVNKDTGMHANN